MIDSVECGGQIRVQRPHTLTCRAASGHKDGLNRVLAAAAGPKPIGSGFEPGLPLRFQCTDGQGLKRPIGDDRDGDFILPLLQSRVGIFPLGVVLCWSILV